jgi:redox-sensitive bicupin YhaK (pirin superfamily)
MGNVEILKRGDVQLTSAGTGIRHSEHSHGAAPVHFLQIWATPATRGLPPRYYTRHVPDSEKTDRWAVVVAPVGAPDVIKEREGAGPTPVQSPVSMRAGILNPGVELKHTLPETAGERKAYVHVIQRSGYACLSIHPWALSADVRQV